VRAAPARGRAVGEVESWSEGVHEKKRSRNNNNNNNKKKNKVVFSLPQPQTVVGPLVVDTAPGTDLSLLADPAAALAGAPPAFQVTRSRKTIRPSQTKSANISLRRAGQPFGKPTPSPPVMRLGLNGSRWIEAE